MIIKTAIKIFWCFIHPQKTVANTSLMFAYVCTYVYVRSHINIIIFKSRSLINRFHSKIIDYTSLQPKETPRTKPSNSHVKSVDQSVNPLFSVMLLSVIKNSPFSTLITVETLYPKTGLYIPLTLIGNFAL